MLLVAEKTWIMLWTIENLKPEKCFKITQNLHYPVHAMITRSIFLREKCPNREYD